MVPKLACAEDDAAELLWPCCFPGSVSPRCGVQLFPCTLAAPASRSWLSFARGLRSESIEELALAGLVWKSPQRSKVARLQTGWGVGLRPSTDSTAFSYSL